MVSSQIQIYAKIASVEINGDSQGTSIKQRWKDYLQELLNGRAGMDDDIINGGNDIINDDNEDSIFIPTSEEIKISLKVLRNNKAPGADNIPAELLKCGADEVVRLIHKLIMDVWEKEYVPKEWRKSIICPIYKKGDKLKCMNYRGIALLCTAYKLFANILRNRLEPIIEGIIGEYQAGFRPGRSTIDQLFTVKQTLGKCWE
jgi:hypothetical protein